MLVRLESGGRATKSVCPSLSLDGRQTVRDVVNLKVKSRVSYTTARAAGYEKTSRGTG